VTAIFCDVSQLPSVSYLFGVSRHRFLAALTVSEAVANFALSIYWGRLYGMSGVALGTLAPMAIAKLFIQPFYVCRHLDIPIGTYYVRLLAGSFLAPALSSVLMWGLVFRKLYLPNIWAVCGVIIFQALICAIAAFCFVFDREERRSILGKMLPRDHQPEPAAGTLT
jgi:hypothetical protein